MEIKRVVNGVKLSFALSDEELREAHKEIMHRELRLLIHGAFFELFPENFFEMVPQNMFGRVLDEVAEIACIYCAPGDCTQISAIKLAVEDYLDELEPLPIKEGDGRSNATTVCKVDKTNGRAF